MADWWRHRWRLVLEREWGEPKIETHTLDTVTELARLVRASQTDGQIIRRSHWQLHEWTGEPPAHGSCSQGMAGWSRSETTGCLCGVDHIRWRCGRCQIDVTAPERTDWCGPLPWQPKGPWA